MKRYKIDYPKLSDHYLYESQQGIKDLIKKIDTCIIDSGLVRAPDTGQLDVDNIPDQNLDFFLNKGAVYRDSTDAYIQYLPLVYCFSDTLQETSPIFISINFELGRMTTSQKQLKSPIGLYTKINVSNGTNGNSVITKGIEFYVGSLGFSSNSNSTNTKVSTDYNVQDSIINYDREKGMLFLNILPYFRFTTEDAVVNHFGDSSKGINRSLIDIIVYRVNDKTIGTLGFNTYNQINQNSNVGIPPKIFRYKNGDVIYNDTYYNTIQGFYNNTQNYINGRIVTSPLTSYDPLNKIMVRNPIMLSSSSSDTGNISGGTLKVIISDTEKWKYMVYSPMAENFNFGSTLGTRVNLLIYDGKVE